MAQILVTGGAGNIGGSLADHLARVLGHSVIVVDDLSTGSAAKLPRGGDWRFIKADVNRYDDLAGVMLSHRFDYVFHYAAVVGVQRTLAHPVDVLRDIDGIRNVLDLAKNTDVRRVFFSSSSEVYGEPVEFPQHEVTTPLNSRLPYAVVKNVGEAFFRSYHHEYGLPYTIFRFFNTYGPRQSADFVMSRFVRAALAGEDLTVYGDGSQTRTFCYVDDNIEATTRALSEDVALNDVLNVGNDEEVSVLDLARIVIEETGSSSRIVHLPPLAEGDMTRRCPDISRMKALLGRPPLPVRQGIHRVIEAFQTAPVTATNGQDR